MQGDVLELPVTGAPLKGEVMRPSALGAAETAAWRQMQAQSPSLRRAFLSPSFALACERASSRAYVAVLHDGSGIRGFLPFQFRTIWHERLRLAERIGGSLSDAAGIIAPADLRITATSLMRVAGLASMSISHLMEGQQLFGLDAVWSQVGHVTDLHAGPEAYFADLLQRDRILVRDTERRLRKADKDLGALRLVQPDPISADMVAALIAEKRRQYRRTQVPDVFARAENLRLIDVLNEAPEPECRLVMNRLEAGGRVLEQHLGPRHHDVLSHWFPVYDPDARTVSPGRLLLWYMIQRANEDGIRLIDYGEGDALYKRELATGSVRYGRAGWSSGSVRSLLARGWQSLEWRLQRRLQRTRKPAVEQA